MSGQLQALATLHLGKEPPVPTECEAGWSPKPASTPGEESRPYRAKSDPSVVLSVAGRHTDKHCLQTEHAAIRSHVQFYSTDREATRNAADSMARGWSHSDGSHGAKQGTNKQGESTVATTAAPLNAYQSLGNVVVKALSYKPEGRGFETR
jgi:hypothetical protein